MLASATSPALVKAIRTAARKFETLTPNNLSVIAMEAINSLESPSIFLETDLAQTHPDILAELEALTPHESLLVAREAINLLLKLEGSDG